MQFIEFFNGNDGTIFVVKPDSVKRLEMTDTEIIDYILEVVQNNYTEAWKALSLEYASAQRNVPYFKFVVVRRFLKCNMGENDLLDWDIDGNGQMHLEMVKCPMRGECPLENIVCKPKFSTGLSARESEVLALLAEGHSNQEVADLLFISIHTVKIHAAHILDKLGLKTIRQAAAWYRQRKP